MSVFSDGYQSAINREARNLRKPVDETTGFLDNVQASFRNFVNEEQSISRLYAMQPELDANFKAYTETTKANPPEEAFYIRHISAQDADIFDRASKGDEMAMSLTKRRQYQRGWAAWQWWKSAAEQYPEQVKTYDQLVSDASKKLAIEREKNMKVMQNASGLGKVGQFAGAMGGAVVDPINVATLGFGSSVTMAKGLGTAAKLAELSVKGFAINAATESLIQPSVYAFKKELGVDYSVEDAITNILIAGAGGAVLAPLPTASKITYKGFKKNVDSIAFKVKYAIDQGQLKGLDAKASLKAVRSLQEALEANPFKEMDPSITGIRTHLTALEKATFDFRDGKVADVGEITKGIDAEIYPAWQKLEQVRQTVRKEIAPTLQNAQQLQKDLQIVTEELAQLSRPDVINQTKQRLMAENRLPARQAKKEVKQFIESRTQELKARSDALQRDLAPAMEAQKSADLAVKINRMIDEGKQAPEILNMVKRERPDLMQEQPAPKITERVPAQEPELEMVTPEIQAKQETQQTETYKVFEVQSQSASAVAKSTNQKLYGDVKDIDVINQKALEDVEKLLTDDDFLIPDAEGNLVSAREVLDEASRGVESAAQLRACFIGG